MDHLEHIPTGTVTFVKILPNKHFAKKKSRKKNNRKKNLQKIFAKKEFQKKENCAKTKIFAKKNLQTKNKIIQGVFVLVEIGLT